MVANTADHVINNTKSTTVSFTVGGLDNTGTGTVNISDGTRSMTVSITGNGTYSANLHSLDDASITSTLSFTDTFGNLIGAAGDAVTLDTDKTEVATLVVADTADHVIDDTKSTTVSFTVGGLDNTGTGTVTFSDGTHSVTVSITGNGTYSANLHSLDDASITSTLSFTDTFGNLIGTAGNAVTLDTDKTEVATLVVADTADHVINNTKSTTVSFTVGGLDNTGTGTVTFSDGTHSVTVSITGNGTYSANLHSLDDASITSTLSFTDTFGNLIRHGRQCRHTRHRQDRGGDACGRRHRRPRHQQHRVDHRLLHGRRPRQYRHRHGDLQRRHPQRDRQHHWQWHLQRQPAFARRRVDHLDAVLHRHLRQSNRHGRQCRHLDTDKTEVATLVVADTADHVINNTKSTTVSFTVGGLDNTGTGTVTFSDGTHSVTVSITGNGTYSANLHSLDDASITSTLSFTDTFGNLIGTAGECRHTRHRQDRGGDACGRRHRRPRHQQHQSTTVSFTVGGLDNTGTGTVTFSDGTHSVTVSITGNGTYSANLHSLDDASITSTLSFTDTFGNLMSTAGNAVTLDTDKTEVATLVVADTADHVINNTKSTTVSFTVGGLDNTGTGTVTFSDGTHSVTVSITGNGTYSANLHSLDDASITSTLSFTDTFGNLIGTAGKAVTLDTDKTEVATLVVADTADRVINNTKSTTVSFTVGGLDNTGTGTVTFSDGTHSVTVSITGNGTYSANLHSLTAASITSTLSFTDTFGNLIGTAGNAVVLDDAPTGFNFALATASLSALENAGGSGNALDDAEQIATFTQGGGVAGDTYTFTIGGGILAPLARVRAQIQ